MRQRAVTLAETLVLAILMFLVLAAVYGIYLMGKQYFDSAQSLTQTQQSALQGIANLERMLSQAEGSTVTVQTAPPAVVFLSARTEAGPFAHDEHGELLWQRWGCIYLDADRLVLKERTLGAPTATAPEPIPTASSLIGDAQLRKQVLAHDVSELLFPARVSSRSLAVELVTRLQARRSSSGVGVRTDQAVTEARMRAEIPLQED